jgi:hypothetical protein
VTEQVRCQRGAAPFARGAPPAQPAGHVTDRPFPSVEDAASVGAAWEKQHAAITGEKSSITVGFPFFARNPCKGQHDGRILGQSNLLLCVVTGMFTYYNLRQHVTEGNCFLMHYPDEWHDVHNHVCPCLAGAVERRF